jgi:hypothetical protein
MDNARDRDHLRVIIQLALGKLRKVLAVALDRRSEHQYGAQRQVAQSVADAVLDGFDVKRKEQLPTFGAGALYRGPPEG